MKAKALTSKGTRDFNSIQVFKRDYIINTIKSSNKLDSILSCVETKRFFWTKNGEPINYDYNSRPRRQDFEGILMENGAFYINTVANIKNYKNLFKLKRIQRIHRIS